MSDHEDAAPELNPEDAPLEADEEKPEVAPAATAAEAGLGDDDDDDDDGPVVARRRERRGAVLDDESDDDDDDDDSAAKKKKRKAQELELDEDDYDLLEDNQVTGFRRPKEKKKRLQKAADREKGASGKEKQKPKTVRDVERDLFGDDDEDEPGPGASEKPKPEAAPVDEGGEEFCDFRGPCAGVGARRGLRLGPTCRAATLLPPHSRAVESHESRRNSQQNATRPRVFTILAAQVRIVLRLEQKKG